MKGLKQYKSINEYKLYFKSSLLMVYLIFLDDSPLPITKVNLYRDKVSLQQTLNSPLSSFDRSNPYLANI